MEHPLNDTEKRLRDLAIKYSTCRHGCSEYFCTQEALAELGRIFLREKKTSEAKSKLGGGA